MPKSKQGIPVIENDEELYSKMTEGELDKDEVKYLGMMENRKKYKRGGKKYANSPGRIKRRQEARRRDSNGSR